MLLGAAQGRHIGQSISRAQKAEDMEKHLPRSFAELRALLQEWAVEHAGPFLINGTNYLVRRPPLATSPPSLPCSSVPPLVLSS